MQAMRREAAEQVALAALGWIAADEERAQAFLGASGADAGDLRAQARDPMFLGFVLDFVVQDDESVLALAAHLPCAPEDILRARAGLPGGDLPEWT